MLRRHGAQVRCEEKCYAGTARKSCAPSSRSERSACPGGRTRGTGPARAPRACGPQESSPGRCPWSRWSWMACLSPAAATAGRAIRGKGPARRHVSPSASTLCASRSASEAPSGAPAIQPEAVPPESRPELRATRRDRPLVARSLAPAHLCAGAPRPGHTRSQAGSASGACVGPPRGGHGFPRTTTLAPRKTPGCGQHLGSQPFSSRSALLAARVSARRCVHAVLGSRKMPVLPGHYARWRLSRAR